MVRFIRAPKPTHTFDLFPYLIWIILLFCYSYFLTVNPEHREMTYGLDHTIKNPLKLLELIKFA